MGELITQRGIGNGMSLIIFVSIVSRALRHLLVDQLDERSGHYGIALTVLILCLSSWPGIRSSSSSGGRSGASP